MKNTFKVLKRLGLFVCAVILLMTTACSPKPVTPPDETTGGVDETDPLDTDDNTKEPADISIGVKQMELKTVYDSPATDWKSETFMLGNGYMGATVYGGVSQERILINEHTLWSGGPGANAFYDGGRSDVSAETNHKNLQRIRELLAELMEQFSESYTPGVGVNNTKNYPALSSELTSLINSLKGEKTNFGSYQELGSVYVEDFSMHQITSYGDQVLKPAEVVDNIFDNNNSTKWYSIAGTVGYTQKFPLWAQIELEKTIKVSSYSIALPHESIYIQNRNPSAWKLLGSNDGQNWTTVDVQTNISFASQQQVLKFNVSGDHSYRFWRFQVDACYGGNGSYGIHIGELRFYDEDGRYIDLTGEVETDTYSRSLDLNKAVANVHYELGDTAYDREYFVSNPGNFVAARFTANKEGALNKAIRFGSAQKNITVTAEGDTITVIGSPSDHTQSDKLVFAFQVKVVTDGTLKATSDYVTVTGATEIELYMTAGTNYRQCMDDSFEYLSGRNPLNGVKDRLEELEDKTYEELKKTHIEDYQSLFNRVQIGLVGAEVPDKTTDELLEGYKNYRNTDAENRYLETLYYQMGRYLLISSSREGSLPANLQGIWVEGLTPPWQSDYHTNINVQMTYWLAEQTNLSECHQPLIDYINSLVARGTLTALAYHVTEDGDPVRGWTTYHENNIWGNTSPATSEAFYFPTGAAWLCQHIWEQYAFTLDKEALAESYDTLKLAALFWVDNLVTDPRDGKLVVSPSRSPEHGPYSLGCSADQVMVWELFNCAIKAAEVMEDTSSEIDEIREAMENLALPEIGVNGQYMEWRDEVTIDVTGDNKHRHVNHLFALHPGTLVVAGRSPEDDAAIEAMKKTLNTRGDDNVGWSTAWKINFWARLRDANRAGSLVRNIISTTTFDNLCNDDHGFFVVDGNTGATAGMTEMFLQSQGDAIELLPALPTMWYGSSISGICARGDIEVGIESDSNGMLKKAVLKVGADNDELKVKAEGLAQYTVKTADGTVVETTKLDDNTIVFAVKAGETYVLELSEA